MSDDRNLVEGVKMLIDYFKHLTTLSTGSILVIATLADKFAPEGTDKSILGYSIAGFIVCILSMLIAGAVLVLRAEEGNFSSTKGAAAAIESISFCVGAIAFIVAITFVAFFAWNVLNVA